MDWDGLIQEGLRLQPNALLHFISQELQKRQPERFVLETASWAFNLQRFYWDKKCTLRTLSGTLPQWDWSWDAQHRSDYADFDMGVFEIEWEGKKFEAVLVAYSRSYRRERRWYVVANSQADARALFKAVADWTTEVQGEVLVFDGGCWNKSKELFEAIQNTDWDSLILEGDLKTEIQGDIATFFESKAVYDRYRIPWKRGILFLGPPGNGKTHTIKAIVGSIGRPCLYVKSFRAEHRTDHDLIGEVFRRARATAPCVLVLEDLDALIDDQNRSFFLNELDGFASNEGILTLATTNHPERLDPAILERPSRFDRKYTFALPEPNEREVYLRSFSDRLESDLRLSEEELLLVAAETDGYSFAYLKELYLSAMMRWIAKPNAAPIATLMTEQAEALRAQMATDPGDPPHANRKVNYSAQAMRAYMERGGSPYSK